MAKTREMGIVGLGKMGGGLAKQALGRGIRVVAAERKSVGQDFLDLGVEDAERLSGFKGRLASPRVIMVFVPAGPAVDQVLDALAESLEPGDIVLDGGNSYWGDSIRRYRRLSDKGLHFIDMGTSGGVTGAENGACFMCGGERGPVETVEPLLRDLAVEGGYVHAGPPGAGHFVKLVHNGIEFGMLQAIAEGVDLLQNYDDELDVQQVLECWRHGSVIRSWLVDLMAEQFRAQGGTTEVPAYVEDTGEVNWLVSDALRLERPIPVIAQAVMQLLASRDGSKQWARSIAMMRHGFGGHPFGSDESIRRERSRGRVGPICEPEESQQES